MNNLFLKSSDADFQKINQQIKVIHKNVLYLTYQVDFIRKKILSMEVDKSIQKQADDFYEEEDHNPIHPADQQD